MLFLLQQSDGVIDDEKLRNRSAKAEGFSLVCSKSAEAYGPVGNCVKCVHTGIPLSCVYSHFGDSSTGLLKSNLGMINGATTNPNSIRMQDSINYGDRGK